MKFSLTNNNKMYEKNKYNSVIKELSPYMNLGFQMVIPILGGTFLGLWLDGKYDLKPILTITGSILGIIMGFYIFFNTIKQNEKKRKDKK